MDSIQAIKDVAASLLRVDASSITEETSVVKFNSSLERTKLERALTRAGFTLASGKVGPRFADLVRQANAGGDAPTESLPVVAEVEPDAELAPITTGTDAPTFDLSQLKVHLGVDIENVSALPVVNDQWENDFYRATFTPAEIAKAQSRPDPRVHLTGIWCAKEALKKSSPKYLKLPMDSISVAHLADGSPVIRVLENGKWVTLPYSVSISHTDDVAVAVVSYVSAVR
jgi:holo-[acyl-carrier protein] synthase